MNICGFSITNLRSPYISNLVKLEFSLGLYFDNPYISLLLVNIEVIYGINLL